MKNFNLFKFAIGDRGIDKIKQSKIIFSSLVYSKDFKRGANIILKNKNTPNFELDWTVYKILRTICKTWIVTGQVMRDERELKILNNIEEYLNLKPEISDYLGIKSRHNFKNFFFYSKSITSQEIMTYECFREKNAIKYVLQNKNFQDNIDMDPTFLEQNNIHILSNNDFRNFNYLSEYIITKIDDSLPILAEIGPKTLKDLLSGKEGDSQISQISQIDFLLISVYSGDLDSQCIGGDFPSLPNLTCNSKYSLIYKSEPVDCLRGSLTFYTLIKKT